MPSITAESPHENSSFDYRGTADLNAGRLLPTPTAPSVNLQRGRAVVWDATFACALALTLIALAAGFRLGPLFPR
jgi:hypothetical protein